MYSQDMGSLCTWRLGHSHMMQGSLIRTGEMFKCCLADGKVLFPMKRKQWLDYSLVPLFSVGFRVDSKREGMAADHCSFFVKSPARGKHHLLSFKQCQQPHSQGSSLLPRHWIDCFWISMGNQSPESLWNNKELLEVCFTAILLELFNCHSAARW